ncbi:hypothetical protein J3R30DRAFT_3704012 [Lentinula aciculospora]|uniref:Uncharacterized protein n=1 Tax=Lentinula aciculospora TaxID=153920 RepID=A0A9W9DMP2_9AGAR|nr:hypothetical protein J3R30DRAFT_3704012 [Lentinula aciculospora]
MATAFFGLPAFDAAEKEEWNSSKLLKKHKIAQLFDMKEPWELTPWLNESIAQLNAADMKSDRVRIMKLLDWMQPKTRKVFRKLEEATTATTFDNFVKKLKETFSESVTDELGSKAGLLRVIGKYKPIWIGEQERLCLYNTQFKAKAAKLQTEPVILSNIKAVTMYLFALDPDLVTQVKLRLMMTVQTDPKCQQEDPYMLRQIITAAESLDFGVGFDSIYAATSGWPSSSSIPNGTVTNFRGEPAINFPPALPNSKGGYRLKQEPKRDDEAQSLIVQMKDMMTLQVKREEAHKKCEAEKISKENVAQLANLPAMSTPRVNPPTGRRMPAAEYLCHMCKSPEHMMYQCTHFMNFTVKGWLVPESPSSKRVMLRDGQPMPRHNSRETQQEKIHKYTHEKGWDKSDSFYSQAVDDDDYMDQMEPSSGKDSFAMLLNEIAALEQDNAGIRAKREDDLSIYNHDSSSSSENF